MTSHPVLVVTGGGAGIGRGIARFFSERGYRVALAELDPQHGAAAAAELSAASGQVLFFETDVRSEDHVRSTIEAVTGKWGRIDCLCNNAGIERYKSAEAYTAADFDDIVSTNLRGTFLMTKYAFPALASSRGSIVNISSVQGFANEQRISVYAATKAALLGYTRSTSLDFAAHGVRVNAVCPGAIRTAMTDVYLSGLADPAQELKRLTRNIPLARMGTPADVAAVVHFLASPEAAYITGASIVVDGGLLARLAI